MISLCAIYTIIIHEYWVQSFIPMMKYASTLLYSTMYEKYVLNELAFIVTT